jgi:hypothetical protein
MAAISFDKLFKAFKENLTATILSLFTLTIIFLFGLVYRGWVTERKDLKKQLVDCGTGTYAARVETKQLRDQYIEVMGALKEIQGEVNTLKKLGIIK